MPVAPAGMPTIVVPEQAQRRAGALAVIPVLLLVVMAGAGAAIAVAGKGGSGGARYTVGGRPMPLDANGDGVDDIVMEMTTFGKDTKLRFAAFDPLTGEEIWRTDELGASGEENKAATARGRLVVTLRNTVSGFDGRTGQRVFSTALPELPEALCEHSTGVAVLTKDLKLYPVDLGSGALGAPTTGARFAHERGTRCIDLDPADSGEGARLVDADEAPFRDRVERMQVADAFAVGGTGQTLVVGARQPGTRVPMLALFEGERRLWAAEVPGSEPLLAKEREPEAVAVGSGRVLAAYERSDREELHIVCFELQSGRRAWEVAFPERDFFTSFGITDRYVVYSGFGKARSLALADGRELAVIGGH